MRERAGKKEHYAEEQPDDKVYSPVYKEYVVCNRCFYSSRSILKALAALGIPATASIECQPAFCI